MMVSVMMRKTTVWALLAVLMLACFLGAAHADTIVYVKSDGDNGNSGTSWDDAKQTVQAGIDAAFDAGGGQVWVGHGQYDERIELKVGVQLYGGFAVGEESLAERPAFPRSDPDDNETILDGGHGGSVVVISEASNNATILDGFTIQNGEAVFGGGIYVSVNGNPTIRNCIVRGNIATTEFGGGIYSDHSSPQILDCTITRNRANTRSGGGIFCESGTPNILHNTVSNNFANRSGGGIFLNTNCDGALSQNCIKDNEALINGGGVAYYAGSSAILNSNYIQGNSAVSGGGVYTTGDSSPTIQYNTILENTASGGGGGIFCSTGSQWVYANTIINNRSLDGGGFRCNECGARLFNNVFMGNSTTSVGGAIYLAANSSLTVANNIIARNTTDDRGPAIYADTAYLQATNNTITDNWGSVAMGALAFYNSSGDLANNIVCFNVSGVYVDENSGVSLTNNDFHNPMGYEYEGVEAGATDIFDDPRLVDRNVTNDYHLLPDSPCIDGGHNGAVQADWYDMDGDPRIMGARVDIGADEALKVATPTASPSGGAFTAAVDVAISCTTPDAEIHYTTNGNDPTIDDPAATGPIHVEATSILKLRAFKDGWIPSEIRTMPFRIVTEPGIIYVKQDGDDLNTGDSWEHAKRSLSGGLGVAMAGDQIWIAEGTYTGNITFKNGMAMYGGFAGTESSPNERDNVAHETVLSGSLVTISNCASTSTRFDGFTIRDTHAWSSYSSCGVIYCSNSSPTIINNRITNSGTYYLEWADAGGIICYGGSPVITRNLIDNNRYGGTVSAGIYASDGTPLIEHNTVLDNEAMSRYDENSYGCGIYCKGGASIIRNNVIAGNSGDVGIGIYALGGSALIAGNTLLRNHGSTGSGIMLGNGVSATVANNVSAFNYQVGGLSGVGIWTYQTGSLSIFNNDVFGQSWNYWGTNDRTGSDGNLSVDPALVDLDGGDYHLGVSSPCIDAGDDGVLPEDFTDIDGEARKLGAHVDIGADEFGARADNGPPNAVITVAPVEDSAVCESPVHIEWSGHDDVTLTENLVYSYRLDEGSWSDFDESTSFDLAGLSAGRHAFEVRARDEADKEDPTPAVRHFNFATDTSAPTITSITTNPSRQSCYVNWNTNQPATSQVEYGLTEAYGSVAQFDSALRTQHSVGLWYLSPNTLYHFRVRSHTATGCDAVSEDGTFLTGIPDLRVTSIVCPPETYNDLSFDFRWTVLNDALVTAKGPWVDRLYVSKDAVLGSGDVLVGEYPFGGNLAAGQSVERTQVLSIPRSAIPSDGAYYLIMYTDGANAMHEDSETNNFGTAPIQLHLTPAPDLTIPQIQSPATAYFDQTITVRWEVKNNGNGATTNNWQDRVYLSADPNPSTGDYWQTNFDNLSSLNTGESYLKSADLRIPRGVTGNYYIVVKADAGSALIESNEANNLQNKAISIQVPPLPDLQTTLVQAPDEGFAGSPVSLRWTVKNLGSGATPPDQVTWWDRVWLSRDTTLDGTDLSLGSVQHSGALDVGAEYMVQTNQTIPMSAIGDYYVLVWSDSSNQVYEYVAESNNMGYDPQVIHVQGTPPDLVISAFDAPDTGSAGQTISVRYRVTNQGAFAASSLWYDGVYLATGPTPNPASDSKLAEITRKNTLEAGEHYDQDVTVQLPPCTSGPFHIYMVTDCRSQIPEYDPSLDAEANNTSSCDPITLTSPGVDLRVTEITNPGSGLRGQVIPISWTVKNFAGDTTPNLGWVDNVCIGRNPDGSDAWVLAGFRRQGALDSNADYTRTESVTVPWNAYGEYYVSLRTDASGEVIECGAEDNNRTVSGTKLIVDTELPDLRITGVSAPDLVVAGQTVDVSWTGTNEGPAPVGNVGWRDGVYLSTSPSPSGLRGDAALHGPLSVGSTYNGSATITIPALPAGDYFFVVKSDYQDSIFEGPNEGNNSLARPVGVRTLDMDLRVTSVDAPESATAGHEMTVNWTVTNGGTESTSGIRWYDYVVLSRDLIFDPTDVVLAQVQHTAPLAGGGSYTENRQVCVPSGLSGPYFVIAWTDKLNQAVETDETNNVGMDGTAVQIELAPNADLTVTSIGMPDAITLPPGDPGTISWTVTNQGANPATGAWYDAVYLSTDTAWDIGDVQIGGGYHTGPVASGTPYTAQITGAIPSVPPGDYYCIVRTDLRNAVRESDETNNTGVSTDAKPVDAVELSLGAPYSSALKKGEEHYFKVRVGPGETLSVSLDGQVANSANELYARFGEMVSRSAYDFIYDHPYEEDQTLTAPSTDDGWYYILARSDYSVGTDGYSILARVIPYSIASISPSRGGNAGQVTVLIEGAKFDYFTKVALVRGANSLEPVWYEVADPSRIHATFDLRGLTPGPCDVRVWSEQTIMDVDDAGHLFERTITYGDVTLPSGFEVLAGGGPVKRVKLLLPAFARISSTAPMGVEVANEGTNDLPTPVLLVASPNGTPVAGSELVSTKSDPQEQVLVLGERRPGVLAPGETIIAPLWFKVVHTPSSQFILKDLTMPGVPLDWDSLEDYYRDGGSSDAEWNATWANFKGLVGGTWDSLHDAMRKSAEDLHMGTMDTYYTGNRLILDLLLRARNGQSDDSGFRFGQSSAVFATNLAEPKIVRSGRNLVRGGNPYCSEYRPEPIMQVVEYELRTQAIPALALKFGLTVGALWTIYLDYGNYNTGPPRTGPVARSYTNGSEVVDGNGMAKGFANCAVTQQRQQEIFNDAKARLKKKLMLEGCGLPANTAVQYAIEDLQPPNDLVTGINYSNPMDIPGNIVGGTDKSQTNPDGSPNPDKRQVTGSIWVTRRTDQCDKTQSIELKSDLKFIVDDTVDFCPGDLGAGMERVLTIPLSLCEGNNEALDVNIHAEFSPNPGVTDTLDTTGLECDGEDPEPPAPMCSETPREDDPCKKPNKPADAPDCDPDDEEVEEVPTTSPLDPNDKLGPVAYGPRGFVSAQQALPYMINFENQSTATAWAREVVITDQLDADLDWRTFRPREIGFGSVRVTVPENRSFYQTRLDLGEDYGGLLCDVTASVDIATGVARWRLTAIDPLTGEPPTGSDRGLLPPNDPSTNLGQGYVTYTIRPKSGLATGAEITNSATITFDTEPPIDTNSVTNTLDADAPSSEVNPLPANSANPTFTVTWGGSDQADGSGLKSFDIYVADNGNWSAWQTTSATSGQFEGQMGHTYKFYSIARDNAGNVESAPSEPDAQTTVADYTPTSPSPADGATGVPVNTKLTWTAGVGATTHDLFLWKDGSSKPPTPTAGGLVLAEYQPSSALEYATRYMWQVIAQGAQGPMSGPEWSFITRMSPGLEGAKKKADTEPVELHELVVSAVFADCFYVEAEDRSAGIRVTWNGSVAVGDRVDITGDMGSTPEHERQVIATDVQVVGAGTVIPVMLTNKAVGGGGFEYDPVAGTGQRGVEGGFGTNNIGLLVTVCGRVGAVGADFFYLDDGSGVWDTSIFHGLRVRCTGLTKPKSGDYVIATGISTLIKNGDRIFRCVRVYRQDDVSVVH